MASSLRLNPNRSVSVKYIGIEKTPVIVIDELLLNPEDIEVNACGDVGFSSAKSGYYPGTRTELPRDYIIEILRATYQQIAQVFAIPKALQLKPQAGYYSLVATPEKYLSTLQRIPHFDAVQPYYFALLYYISPSPHGGTGFFRDNATQFERISEERERTYLKFAEHFIHREEEPAAGYITDSTEQFTLYDRVEYRPNRLVVYPGNLLHSGLINPVTDISSNPAQGRLTANIFIDFK